jgi:sialate O-acetylesterase
MMNIPPRLSLGNRFPFVQISAFFFLSFASTLCSRADVRMPGIFGDHMVLQQELKVPIWGTADPGEKVTVTAGAHSGSATADAGGKWRVDLPPFVPSTLAFTLTVAGHNTLKFEDVLIGEVWVASGQSNMELPLFMLPIAADTEAHAADPQLRLFIVTKKVGLAPVTDVDGKWELCSADSVKNFSAIAYFFGRELRAKLNRPVGLIDSCWGGTPIAAWISLPGLQKAPAFQDQVDHHAFVLDYVAHYPEKLAAFAPTLKAWNDQYKAAYDGKLAQWSADVQKAQGAGHPPPPQPAPPAPIPSPPADLSQDFHAPTALFDGMISPLMPYSIRGVIWYQGENNVGEAVEYRTLFPRLISDWREGWGQGDFPFLFVQLAGLAPSGKFSADNTQYANADWPLLREAQAMALTLPNTGMATAIDIGDVGGIHPPDKIDVGLRLALAARHVAYGEDIVDSGPTFGKMTVQGNVIRVSFTHLGGGLVLADAPTTMQGCLPTPTTDLLGFAIAGADQKFVLAQAKIDGATVVVSSPDVPNPVAVRYDWANLTQANLYNKELLPALPFRTDNWDAVISPALPPVQKP